MSYELFKTQIEKAGSELTKENYKQIKQILLDTQNQITTSELSSLHRTDLRELMQPVFEKIKEYQLINQQIFEKEATSNFEFLRDQVMEAIDFTQTHLEDHAIVWQKLLTVQQHFKGKRLYTEQREQLYGTLQKLFELVKKRREQSGKSREKQEEISSYLEKLVDKALKIVEGDNSEKAWATLLQTKDKVMESKLPPHQRKSLTDKLQEGFDVLKIRREEKQKDFLRIAEENAQVIAELLDKASEEVENNEVFKEKWELLLHIQQQFKDRKLEKSARNELYDKLQELFHRVKSEQYHNQQEFEELADQHRDYLTPLVEKAYEMAQNCREFKKTKAYLIKIQSDFKGRRMRGNEREKLFSRLQSAFDLLGNRLDEYIAERRELRRTRKQEALSELDQKIDNLEQALEAEKQQLAQLESSYQDALLLEGGSVSAEKIKPQMEMIKSSITRKECDLEDLYNEMDSNE